MTKHTIDSIAEYLREQSNGKCEILSTEYVNPTSKLLFRCECGNTFELMYLCIYVSEVG